MSLKVIVHRGLNQIGGNIIEMASDSTRIIFDLGLSLDETENIELPNIDGVFNNAKYDAIFISHYHSDHLGLVYEITNGIPVYIGKKSFDIITVSNNYLNKKNIDVKEYLEHNKPIKIGDIKVTPFLCDHSAYDSYMLLAECNEEKILYTGDFRSNGRKSYQRFLNELPTNIDTLICEGTTLSRSVNQNRTESNLENELTSIIDNNSGPIFVIQSSMNIDRLVTVYRAAKRNNRILLQDLYLAEITSSIKDSIPNPITFKDVYVFVTSYLNPNSKRYKLFSKYEKKIGKENISKQKFVMCIRSSMGRYLDSLSKKMSFDNGVLVYSLWKGYLEKEEMKEFIDQCSKLGLKIEHLHTSGHADENALKQLISHVNPKDIIPVHTENPGRLIEIGKSKI